MISWHCKSIYERVGTLLSTALERIIAAILSSAVFTGIGAVSVSADDAEDDATTLTGDEKSG